MENKIANTLKDVDFRQWFGRLGFNPRSSHTKDSKKMVLEAALVNTQHYKVRIKGKVE